MPFVAAALLSVILAGSPSPADGLELSPGPPPPHVPSHAPAVADPVLPEAGRRPLVPLPGLVLGMMLGLSTSLRTGRRGEGEVADPLLQTEPLVVLVSGHGNEVTDFDDLVALMDIDASAVVMFDWRAARLDSSHERASQAASIGEAAGDLHSLLHGLSLLGRPIYLVGFSKGGAAIAELLAWWDQDADLPLAGVYGAALLDPPIAAGWMGALQRPGFLVGSVPDNGGYDPHRCDRLGCRDSREHLGDRSGVDVIVIRNTDAVVTNFRDRPEGLRVYDLDDDGADSAIAMFFDDPPDSAWSWVPGEQLVRRLWAAGQRISDAHNSVLSHPAVAECISAEIALPGGCDDTWHAGPRWPMKWQWISGGDGIDRL